MTTISGEPLTSVVRRSRRLALTFSGVIIATAAVCLAFPRHSLMPLLVLIGVPIVLLAIYSLVFRRVSRLTPVGFILGHYRGRPAFLVPFHPLPMGRLFIIQSMTVGLLLLQSILYRRSWIMFSLAGLLAVSQTIAFLLRRSVLTLTTDALVKTRTGRRRVIPWADLAPADLTRTDVAGGLTEPAFIAHAIRYYFEHPEARADIGTPKGIAALLAE